MPASVEVDEESDDRLEELQTEIRRETGRAVTKRELLTRIIDDAYESRRAIVESFRSSLVPLSEEEKERMRRGRIESGTETDEDDIDDILY